MRPRAGFTIVEIVVAIMVTAVGLLALAGTAALVTRMLARGRRAEVAALFAQQRLERARVAACAPDSTGRVPGAEVLRRGGAAAARNTWSFANVAGAIRIRVVTEYSVAPGRARADTLETRVACGR